VTTRTVTCLFSDIEGSTRLELTLGTTGYREVLERHQVLLREVWQRHGGEEQGTEGDSFFVLFASPAQAVAAAVAGQRALAAEDWPTDAPVRVRMGLHTGEIETTGRGGVIGVAINRTARLAAAAHGGQIVVSEATAALVRDALPEGVTLRDLGAHRLKDLPAPERISQVTIQGLPGDFPPLRSLGLPGSGLPTPLTAFVGREREVSEASDLLRTNRLLTLTGPGGTGKTRLSLAVAASVADDFPDGTWFIELDVVRDPDLVAPTIARVLGIPDMGGRSAVERIGEALGDKRALLVLDNLEQVIAAGRDIAEILRRCPSIHVLVTTRIPLRISGEQEYAVPGLPTPPDIDRLAEVDRLDLPTETRAPTAAVLERYEAARLFVARARAVRPGWTPDDADAPAVAAIVARLQGMPLAIELAAARIRLLGPAAILDRLDHHLALGGGARDRPERQQTLRGAIAWSYDLLGATDAMLLDRLSVFRGGFDPAMAAAVAGLDASAVVDRIGDLVDQSLVRLEARPARDGGPRFALLETIREYGAERLAASSDGPTVARRHAEVYLAFAEQAAPHLSGVDQRAWLDALETEHDNLRAALEHLVAAPEPVLAIRLVRALWRFWQQRGYLNEARARLDAIAALGWELPPVSAAHLAETIGGVAYWQSDRPTALRWYDEALRIWTQLGDRREIANAQYNRGYADMIEVMTGRADRALVDGIRARMEDALAIYRELDDPGGEGNLLWALGSVAYFTADAAAAEDWYRRSRELHRRAGDRSMEAWSLHMLTLSLAGQQRWSDAEETGRHALRHFHEAGDVSGITLVLDDLAIVALGMGRRRRAGILWGAARHLQQSSGTTLADYVEQTSHLFGISTPMDAMEADERAALASEGQALPLGELVAYALEPGADADPRPDYS
jgi:predicted ATPase/class 3 adenylate cyclase